MAQYLNLEAQRPNLFFQRHFFRFSESESFNRANERLSSFRINLLLLFLGVLPSIPPTCEHIISRYMQQQADKARTRLMKISYLLGLRPSYNTSGCLAPYLHAMRYIVQVFHLMKCHKSEYSLTLTKSPRRQSQKTKTKKHDGQTVFFTTPKLVSRTPSSFHTWRGASSCLSLG